MGYVLWACLVILGYVTVALGELLVAICALCTAWHLWRGQSARWPRSMARGGTSGAVLIPVLFLAALLALVRDLHVAWVVVSFEFPMVGPHLVMAGFGWGACSAGLSLSRQRSGTFEPE
jgi:hypothetical protein